MAQMRSGNRYGQMNIKRQISAATWEQIKTAFASGIGLRGSLETWTSLEGTVLARASREGRTQRIEAAKALAP